MKSAVFPALCFVLMRSLFSASFQKRLKVAYKKSHTQLVGNINIKEKHSWGEKNMLIIKYNIVSMNKIYLLFSLALWNIQTRETKISYVDLTVRKEDRYSFLWKGNLLLLSEFT